MTWSAAHPTMAVPIVDGGMGTSRVDPTGCQRFQRSCLEVAFAVYKLFFFLFVFRYFSVLAMRANALGKKRSMRFPHRIHLHGHSVLPAHAGFDLFPRSARRLPCFRKTGRSNGLVFRLPSRGVSEGNLTAGSGRWLVA